MTAPASQVAPQIVGIAAVGQILTATPGVWYSATILTYSYIWHRIPPTGPPGIVAVGTASTYVPVAADVGFMLAVRVTASNGPGSSDDASSDQVGPILGPPVSVLPPQIMGVAEVGHTLRTTEGVWS